MSFLTKVAADLLYSALGHLHDDRYLQSVPQNDHGSDAGLGDDDHTQYYNQTRGDARYQKLGAKAETQTNDIFSCTSPGGTSAWAGTFTAAGSSGATIKYSTTTGTAASMKPSSTAQLGKIRLYNTTRGNHVLISDWVAGTITATANYPVNWTNGDVLTIASQTVSSSLPMVDVEIVSGLTGKTDVFLNFQIYSATVGDRFSLHPFEAWAFSKVKNQFAQAANVYVGHSVLLKIIGNVFSLAWTGTPGYVIVREDGLLL